MNITLKSFTGSCYEIPGDGNLLAFPSAGNQLNLIAPSVQLLLNSSEPGSKFVSKSDVDQCAEELAKAK